jgi:GT2 family glycosyltransferase/glycosyltransferase involved in cell wall biosynthesis/SAM-dependent methyltransferase
MIEAEDETDMNQLLAPGIPDASNGTPPIDLGLQALTHAGLDPLFWHAERLGSPSSWWEHVAFAHWIVTATRPTVLVELGTHAGVSYAAFCHAVMRAELPTRCHAVDTWQGDVHAGAYDESVFVELTRYNQEHFNEFSTLIRSTFDEARGCIEDGSIDLLHIDGLHTYEAVRHDFETWQVKLSARAVVLFHDINERSDDFGVWRLWEELSRQFPSFSFLHGHGLGVLAVGADVPKPVLALCSLSDPGEIARVRTRMARLGERWLVDTRERMLGARIGESDARRQRAEAERDAEREAAIVQRDMAIVQRDTAIMQRDAAVRQAEADSVRAAAAAAQTVAARRDAIAAAMSLRDLQAQLDEMRNSTLWRALSPFRRAVGKMPRPLRRGLRGSAKLAYWTLTLQLFSKLKERRRLVRQYAEPAQQLQAPSRPRPEKPPIIYPRATVAPLLVAGTRTTARDRGAPRLVYISGEPDTPGHMYRVQRHADCLRVLGGESTWMTVEDIPDRIAEIEAAGILVIWRAPWDEHIEAAIAAARRGGARIVFDVDDLMTEPELARVEVIDGIRSQFLTEAKVGEHYDRMRQTMLACDLCFTTTEELAYYLRAAKKTTHVLSNGFDLPTHDLSQQAARQWRQQRTDNLIRIGYAGGSRTHQRDLGLAIGALARLMRENNRVRLVLFRTRDNKMSLIDIEEFPELTGLEASIEWRPLQKLVDLPNELARFDINLAPLEFGNPFCEAKSELKFFEAALVNVPTVASPTGPLRRAIQHGRTGFLAATAYDWYVHLKQLIDDPGVRASIAANAYIAVLAGFGPIQRTAKLARVIDQVRGGAAATTAFALQARLDVEPWQPPKTFGSETIFEHDKGDQAQITVVIPLYNYEDYIVEALESVRDQTMHTLDLVIVDDFSTDRSLAVATEWAERNAVRFNRIAVLKNKANSGLAFCRNSGFAAACTTYVLPLDADNQLGPSCCERLLETIQQGGAAFVYSTIQHFGASNDLLSDAPYEGQHLVNANYIDAMALVSKEAWAIIGGYDHVRHGWEDYDFWCRLAEHGLGGEWLPEVLAYYRVHAKSMIKQQTMVPGNFTRLMADFKRRHPWVSLQNQHEARSVPVSSPRLPDPAGLSRLDKLLPILRCPVSGLKLTYSDDRRMLVSVDGLQTWPIVEGRPILSPGMADPTIMDAQHISNDLPNIALDLIRDTKGLVLNLSAGGSRTKFDHVVEVEYAVFRHTDMVADAHALPFDDAVFDAVIVMNAFEHYHTPDKVAAELLRILKPGGRILVRTAFLQPLHEAPWHFYNCTRYGMAKWFASFDTERLSVSENFCPNHSVAWLLSEAESALRAEVSPQSADAFLQAPIGRMVETWRDPSTRDTNLWTDFTKLSQSTQDITAAGFELVGRKPSTSPDLTGPRSFMPGA